MYFSSIERIALDVGDGTPVLCLHGSLGTSKQWRSLAAHLRSRYRVLAADLLGYAGDEEWPVGAPLRLEDEISPLLASLLALQQPVHLVGHSFGGAVALRLALQRPDLVHSVTLFEPVCFGLLLARDCAANSTHEVRGYADTVVLLAQHGAMHAAGRCFVDYWTGRGAWDNFAPERRAYLARKMSKVAAEWGAVFTDNLHDVAVSRLRMPVTLMCGTDTVAPARRVVELLDEMLPHATTYYVPAVGHMGPFTHADKFNRTVENILDNASAPDQQQAA
jgi:pimeloyl-ACP methyl ester carboxylesterase